MSENLNTTMNETSSCCNFTAAKIAKTVAFCLTFLVSLAGNTVIGIIVYKTKTMRKPINFLVVNMAMSNLLLPIFSMPQSIQEIYTHHFLIGGPLGQSLCKLTYFLPLVSGLVSTQSLVLIAVDRFGAVVFPLRPPLISSKLCRFFILATWILAMLILSPMLLVTKLVEFSGGYVCVRRWNEVFGESSSLYHLPAIAVAFFIPLVLIAILYIIIFLKLKSQKVPGEQLACEKQQRRQRERNVLKMAIAIVLGFAVCLFPLAIHWLLITFRLIDISSSCGLQNFSFVAFFMARANCAVNPCICFIFSRNYREGLKALLIDKAAQ